MTIQQHDGAPAVQAGAGAAALIGAGGQMTATARAEAARAMAEVMAQVQVAQAVPRNMRLARQRVKDSCDQYRFAKAAFYSYQRGGNTITGPTIKLIRELAAAFGNFQWGLVEVDRDPARGYSMMQAWAWDVQTNARDSTTFMVRAVRDLAPEDEGGARRKVPLLDERDIYETNANMGSRRVRAMMQTLLPAWYVEEAEEWCRETIARGPVNPRTGKPDPLAVRLANAVDLFASTYEVRQEELEKFIGAPYPKWGPHDLVRLVTLYESLTRGEIRREEVFPPPGATAEQVAAQAAARGDQPEVRPGMITAGTVSQVENLFASCGWAGEGNLPRRLRLAGGWAAAEGEDPLRPAGWADLTEEQGQRVLARLHELAAGTPPGRRRDALHAELAQVAGQRRNHRGRFAPDPGGSGNAGPDDPGDPGLTGVVVEDPPPDLPGEEEGQAGER